jgi:hypothetical protein
MWPPQAPLFILNSRDDPFFDSATLPSAADVGHGTVRIDYEEHGGHCGFVLSENIRFYPMTYLDQVRANSAADGTRGVLQPLRFTGTKGRAPNGYLAEQLARALEHLDAAGGWHLASWHFTLAVPVLADASAVRKSCAKKKTRAQTQQV